MDASVNRQFYFHADAHAIGASLIEPVYKTFSTDATVSLAQTGGTHHASIGGFEGDKVFSVGYSSVHVHGRFDAAHKQHRTVVSAVVEDLNILNIVTARRMVGQVSVTYPLAADDKPAVANVSFMGTQFEGLRLGGQPVEPVFYEAAFSRVPEELFSGDIKDVDIMPTYGSLAALATDQQKRLEEPDVAGKIPAWLLKRLTVGDVNTALNTRGTLLCPIVQEVSVKRPLSNFGHVVHIPDFGNVFLGEMLLGRSSSHLTMLRVEMGCIAKGTVNVGTSFSNGSFIP